MQRLVEEPADHKECGSYVAGRLRGTTRSRETVVSRSAVTLDADTAQPSLPDQVDLILGYSALVHTTYRHTPEAPRYRIIFQLSRSVTPAEYRTLTWVLMQKLGADQFDKGCMQPERYMFRPSYDPAHRDWYESYVIEGPPVPVDELLASVAHVVPDPVDPQVLAVVERTIEDLDQLASLKDGERMPWPGQPDGVGWDMGGFFIATRLVEAMNSGYADARADWDEHAPPSVGTFDRNHKWDEALKAVGGRRLPSAADDFSPAEGGRPEGEMHGGQIRMAYRLAASYAGRLVFIHGLDWRYWDGRRWALDDCGRAEQAVVAVLRAALAESVGGDKRLRQDASKCESAAGIGGILAVARTLPAFGRVASQVDADPFLFNCANGTLDLRDRTVRPADPADLITKVASGAYDPGAPQGFWESFLETVLPDQEEREYLRRVLGQALYGAVREHLFPVLTGTGANGKGTTYGAVAHAWGDYAAVVNPDLLMIKANSGGPEMMVLRGARLVVASELGKGRVLDDSLMKRLTGGDVLTARHLYSEPVTWSPTHQLLYVTNHKPQTEGDDDAVWRRMRIVPFNVVIPEEERRLDLGEELLLHADAILTWAVAGYFDHEDNGGMREPEAVLRATAAYRHENDAMSRFIEDCCELDRDAVTPAAELWQAWNDWRDDDGAEAMSKKALGQALEKHGFKRKMAGDGTRCWRGLKVRG
jgi:putative DNA primase/helicase